MSRRQRSRSLDRTSEQSTLVSVSMNNQQFHAQRIRQMTDSSSPQKLYLLQLSSTTIPLGAGRTMEMVTACYLIETNDGRHILIDSGTAPDGRTENSSAAENEKNVLEHLSALHLRPEDIATLNCPQFDVD